MYYLPLRKEIIMVIQSNEVTSCAYQIQMSLVVDVINAVALIHCFCKQDNKGNGLLTVWTI